jgi:protein-S-isoprenylcysteine O-methyltransferase Ste14
MADVSRARDVVVSVCWYVITGGVAAALVPWWLTGWHADHSRAWWPAAAALGVVFVCLGLVATGAVFVAFVRAGGTPMPGAMTGQLVVAGLNRYVRNPIYLGALAVFLGETLLLLRWGMLLFTGAAWLVTAAFVRWYEEPLLVRRFGADYEAYRRAVRAWIPRLRPWTPDEARHA